MDELSRDANEHLAAFRASEPLPVGAKARMWAEVAKGTGFVAPADGAAASTGAPTTTTAATKAGVLSKLGAWGVGVLAVGITVPVGVWLLSAKPNVDPQVEASALTELSENAVTTPDGDNTPSNAPGNIQAVVAESDRPTPAFPSAESDEHHADGPATVEQAPTVSGDPVARRRTRPRTRGPDAASNSTGAPGTAAPSPAADTNGIEEEVRLMRAAHQALTKGDHQHALSLLTAHARRFPNGKMVKERKVARMVALCEAGRGDESRALRDDFLRAHPNSPLASRVRGVCRQ